MFLLAVAHSPKGQAAEELHQKIQKPAIAITIKLSADGNTSPTLAMTLKNVSNRTLRLYKDALPWESRHSIVLILRKTKAGQEILNELLTIDDPLLGEIKLEPNQQLDGVIDLAGRFPTLQAARERTDVLLFWSYQLEPVNEAPEERLGGWLLLPKILKR